MNGRVLNIAFAESTCSPLSSGLVGHSVQVYLCCRMWRITCGAGSSLGLDEDVVVVGGHSPVLAVIVLVRVVLLVEGKEGVELEALLEVLGRFQAANVFEHVEVTVRVGAGLDQAVPVNALELHVRIVLLKAEVHGRVETDVWALDRVHVLAGHLKLAEVEVFGEHLHLDSFTIKINYNFNRHP